MLTRNPNQKMHQIPLSSPNLNPNPNLMTTSTPNAMLIENVPLKPPVCPLWRFSVYVAAGR